MVPTLTWAGILLLAVLPLVTMRLISSERQKKTWPLLLGSPASPWQIVLGKYLAMLGFITLACALIALLPLSLYFGASVDGGQLLTSLLGLWLLLAALAAAGLYFSTLTTEPGTAALATFGLLLFLYVLQVSASMPGTASPLFYYLSPWSHFTDFLMAKFDSRHLVYYLLFIAFFLWLAAQRLQRETTPGTGNRLLAWGKHILVFGGVIAIAWLSLRHPLTMDLSHYRQNSLPPEAIAILNKLDGPVQITAVVENRPDLHRRIEAALAPFRQVKKDITLEFADISLQRLQQRDLNPGGELVLQAGDKKEIVHTLEQGVLINSFHRLASGRQRLIVFLEGHGESNLLDTGSEGASKLAHLLRAQGYQTYSHNLIRVPQIPDNTTVLVIAGARQDFLPEEVRIITDWLQRGGALLWLHDDEKLHGLDPLLDILPVDFLPGTIVNADQNVQQLIGSKHPAVFPVIDYNQHPLAKSIDGQTILAFTRAVEFTGQPPWRAQSFLQTPAASWNETGSLQGHVKPDTEEETGGPFSVGLTLQRPLGDREQRVAVIGDRDFPGNELIGHGRNSMLALNIIQWLGSDKTRLQAGTRTTPDARLELTPMQLNAIAVFFLAALPLAFLLTGLRQWRKYR